MSGTRGANSHHDPVFPPTTADQEWHAARVPHPITPCEYQPLGAAVTTIDDKSLRSRARRSPADPQTVGDLGGNDQLERSIRAYVETPLGEEPGRRIDLSRG